MRTAVVTLAHQRHEHLALQQQFLGGSAIEPDRYIVVAMGDPELTRWQPESEPRPTLAETARGRRGLPLAQARNVGAELAIDAGAELLIFLDVDCLPDTDLIGWYRRAAQSAEAGGSLLCGPVAYLPPAPPGGYALDSLGEHLPHPARPAPRRGELASGGDPNLFWSLSFAVTAEVWRRIGGFCEEYQGYGGEDTDFAQTAARRGVGLAWVGGALAYHQYHPSTTPPVQHLDDILRNGALFASRWGWWPMQGWLDAFVGLGLVYFDRPSGAYVKTSGVIGAEPPL